MATYYFVGGEDHDFTKLGACTVDTSTSAGRRTTYARCSLKVSAGGVSDGWTATLSAPQAAFWTTARFLTFSSGNGYETLSFADASSVKRLGVDITAGVFRLFKRSAAGTVTALASALIGPTNSVLYKLDIFINYGASGSFLMYLDGTLVLSYSGNLVTDSATALASITFGAPSSSSVFWSEIICADVDTRSMSLVTLAPSANGNAFTFDSGSVASINETTLDDATIISSGTVGQLAQFTVGSSGVTGTPAIKAVAISARASKGATGPQAAKFGVRTGGANYAGAAIPLPGGSLARIAGTFTTNPATGNPWTVAELTAAGFNIGIVSDT